MQIAQRAQSLLEQMLQDPNARFRDGQLACIVGCVESRKRLLVVQKTGWGKSFVYFIATKLLREAGSGPTLLISPLLSLMRNQIAMASRIGIRADRIDSTNQEEWPEVMNRLRANECDVLLVSPERLGCTEFITTVLLALRGGIGMFVIDEAHCISDWGHDFRPDYRRIRRFVERLPEAVPVLATTATANDRVVDDIVVQLGLDLQVIRGPLLRESLHLQVINLPSYAARLAWLAQYLNMLPGSGIIYCLTKHDCELVSEWLDTRGIAAPAYHSSLADDQSETNSLRQQREEMLQNNRLKALVATVALGMGYDKPDLGFVIHFQRPGSIVAYYQQIGRAGRAIDKAIVVLLWGKEDDEITSYFIETAFPDPGIVDNILTAIQSAAEGLSAVELLSTVNQSASRIERCLKYLEVETVVKKVGSKYLVIPGQFERIDRKLQALVTDQRYRELATMNELCAHTGCYMTFIAHALDDPCAAPCGKCANCSGAGLLASVDEKLCRAAVDFLKSAEYLIEPRRRWPSRSSTQWTSMTIPSRLLVHPGRALSVYFDAGWGRLVHDNKYREGAFCDELVEAACSFILTRWRPVPYPAWVTAIPSLRHRDLVPNFARRLAAKLAIPYRESLVKIRNTAEQKLMQNRSQQVRNLVGAFVVKHEQMLPGAVLLIDDIVDSRWTLTYTGALLREAGASRVYPFALAYAGSGLG